MSYKVSAVDLSAIRLNEPDPIASVLQNISVILRTQQGTVPMYREFGLPMKFLDKPIPVAKPMLYIEAKEAIELYEPRATVLGSSVKNTSSTIALGSYSSMASLASM